MNENKMNNLNSKDECELNKSKPRIIKKFEKPPPLRVSARAQRSERTSSIFKDKINVPTPIVEVTNAKNDVHCEKHSFKNESNVPVTLLNNNLSDTQDKYQSLSEKNSNEPEIKTMPANQRLSSLINRLKQLQVAPNKVPEEGNFQDNLSSTNKKIQNNQKSSCLNNNLSSKPSVMNGTSKQLNGSQDKNQTWSLSGTIWSPDVQVKSKEISCSLSLEGTLILTNMYSGSLCSTKEYSNPTLLKTLNLVQNNDWQLSKKIWSADQVSLENDRLKKSDNYLQSNANCTVPDKNGFSSEFKTENTWRTLEKENNLSKASQSQQHTASVQQEGETQFAQQAGSQHANNSASMPAKKSRMSMLLERLRTAAHGDQPSPTDSSPTVPPKLSPSKASSTASSNPSSPSKSKSPSSSSPTARAASISSQSSDKRPRSSCFNCGRDDHKYYKCPQPVKQKFCGRCGWEDVDRDTCPFCTGTLVRPGSSRPVPVGGDARTKYASVDIDQIREETKMVQELKNSRGKKSR